MSKRKTTARQISPTAALRILTAQGAYTPHKAAMVLTEAIGANDCRLWGDGNLVKPDYFQTAVALTASVEVDGRWRAEIVSTQDPPWHPKLYRKRRPQPYAICKLDEHEVMALLPADAGEPMSTAQWAVATTRRLLAENRISEDAKKKKAELARLLKAEVQKAVKAGQLGRTVKASYLENQLEIWGIWPLSDFK